MWSSLVGEQTRGGIGSRRGAGRKPARLRLTVALLESAHFTTLKMELLSSSVKGEKFSQSPGGILERLASLVGYDQCW